MFAASFLAVCTGIVLISFLLIVLAGLFLCMPTNLLSYLLFGQIWLDCISAVFQGIIAVISSIVDNK